MMGAAGSVRRVRAISLDKDDSSASTGVKPTVQKVINHPAVAENIEVLATTTWLMDHFFRRGRREPGVGLLAASSFSLA
jgi:hypothetical protein